MASAERRLAAGVGLAAFALYFRTACPTVWYGDSGELIAASASLGVAHPPGYPLYTALGRLALALPVGEAAWRVNLLSALFGAAACAGVAVLVRRWSGSTLAAAGAGLALAVSRDVWAVSIVAEVYTMHLALLVALLLVADGSRRGGGETGAGTARLWVAAALVGLGLAHRPTIVLALPAAAALALGAPGGAGAAGRARRVGAWLGALGLAAAIPLAAYGWMLLRAMGDPAVNWGGIESWNGLWSHVTTRGYRFYVLGPEGWLRPEGWARAARTLWAGFPGLGLPLAAAGLIVTLAGADRTRRRPGVAVSLLGAAWLLFGLSYATEDVQVLFLPLCLAVALALGLGLAALSERTGRGAARILPPAALVASVAVPLLGHGPSTDLSGTSAAADYGRDMLATVERGGALFVEGDDAFLLLYLQQVLREREDVEILDRNGQIFGDELRRPGPPAGRGETPLRYRVRREQEFALAELARGRPVLFMVWPGYDMPPALRFEPFGLFYRVMPASAPPTDPRGLWTRYHEEAVTRAAERTGDPFASTVAATYPLMRGERSLFEGRPDEASAQFDRASRLARNSETIHNYLGTIHGRLGDLERAEREFLEAARIKPVSIRAWNNLGQARLLRGDLRGAREAWRRSLAVEPDQPEVRWQLQRQGDGR